jgi:glycosyltransferase involved in cell wall biosynthesis
MAFDFNIGFFSNLMGSGINHGYGYAAVRLIEAWQRQQVPVWAMNQDADIFFNFVKPSWYEYSDKVPCIGYTPWESSAVPEAWPIQMNTMDEIWTTSEACADWYRDAGVNRPIRVLAPGIDRNDYPLEKRVLKDTVKYLHIGAEAPRKGAQLAYHAYCKAFPEPSAEQTLTLKCCLIKNNSLDFEINREDVIIINEKYSQQEMSKLYLDHDVMFYPCNGEGFGLIPFQAAATGMPVWVTNWSGPRDFMQFCWPIEISGLVTPHYEPHIGLWAQPKVDDVIDKMRAFRQDPEYFFAEAHRKASSMGAEWSWDALAEKSLNWMSELLAQGRYRR